ncbi:adenosine receptor A1 isoform X1 [Sorex fumeus]|uniref:adenosine receptor A1 isoform X1 n=1 Tax=Sorex fumeus TaxID=62283 RepID=UPI0024ADE2C3|nr:adenosine receptor A1 isoform X1 [Sorex fumeus]XP_055966569.1 adenosine receptor A1 isoform X1 [Sorex fumeus]
MPPSISAFQAAYIGIEVLIALVSVPGNVLVIWAVKVNQALRDATFCFIVSLAVADVAVGALVIPLAILINVGPQTYFHTCLMFACPVLILTQSSILALLAIAVDRYLRVKIPLRYKTVVTPRRAAVAIAGCWILSFMVGLTPMFGWNNLREVERAWAANGSQGEPVIKCEFEKVISMEYMVYFNFFVWVLPPLLLMVLIYLEVFYLIRKQLSKKLAAPAHPELHHPLLPDLPQAPHPHLHRHLPHARQLRHEPHRLRLPHPEVPGHLPEDLERPLPLPARPARGRGPRGEAGRLAPTSLPQPPACGPLGPVHPSPLSGRCPLPESPWPGGGHLPTLVLAVGRPWGRSVVTGGRSPWPGPLLHLSERPEPGCRGPWGLAG